MNSSGRGFMRSALVALDMNTSWLEFMPPAWCENSGRLEFRLGARCLNLSGLGVILFATPVNSGGLEFILCRALTFFL